MNKLVFVRHGHSHGNIHDRHFADDSTNFLTLKGVGEAVLCGHALQERRFCFGMVFCSEFTRAKQTAVILMEILGLEHLSVHGGLNERAGHDTESMRSVSARSGGVLDKIILPALVVSDVLVVSHFFTINAMLCRQRPGVWPEHGTRHDHVGISNATPYILQGDDKVYGIEIHRSFDGPVIPYGEADVI